MKTLSQTLLVLGLLVSGSLARAAEFKVGDFVFPKETPGQLKVENRVVAEVKLSDFLKVLEARDGWLWVECRSVFTPSTAGQKGWVRASDMDNLDQQVHYIETLIRQHPKEPFYYTFAGRLYSLSDNSKHLEAAIWYLNRALQINSAYEDAYRVRACCWADLKQFDKAIADCEQLLKLNPDNEACQEFLAALRQLVELERRASEPAPPAVGDPAPAAVNTAGTKPAA